MTVGIGISDMTDPLDLRGGVVHCEEVPLPLIVRDVGTPYSTAAMNDLMRPSLYDAWHAIVPSGQNLVADIVGPVCGTGDTFARSRRIACMKGGTS